LKDSNKLSKDFLYHLVFSKYFVGELFRLFGNSSQQPNVSPSQLESFKVPIPEIEEQNQIANALFILDRKARIAESRKKTLTALFKTLLHELMTGQRRVHELEFEVQQSIISK
jgi:type I restriction enzyme S subunit